MAMLLVWDIFNIVTCTSGWLRQVLDRTPGQQNYDTEHGRDLLAVCTTVGACKVVKPSICCKMPSSTSLDCDGWLWQWIVSVPLNLYGNAFQFHLNSSAHYIVCHIISSFIELLTIADCNWNSMLPRCSLSTVEGFCCNGCIGVSSSVVSPIVAMVAAHQGMRKQWLIAHWTMTRVTAAWFPLDSALIFSYSLLVVKHLPYRQLLMSKIDCLWYQVLAVRLATIILRISCYYTIAIFFYSDGIMLSIPCYYAEVVLHHGDRTKVVKWIIVKKMLFFFFTDCLEILLR